VVHLNHRDVSLATVSIAPLAKLLAYQERMQWSFRWVSSEKSSFNQDFGVSHKAGIDAKGAASYNYGTLTFRGEAPGISVFRRAANGDILHTYSCYARGLDMLNGTYHMLDLIPKGRDESDLPFTMSWLRRHDEYEG
jgi:predicted dithiol-disulfide oxidoreductase (DUF899 family)